MTTRIKATLHNPIPSNPVVMTQNPVGMTLTHVNAIRKAVAVSAMTLPGPGMGARSRFMMPKQLLHRTFAKCRANPAKGAVGASVFATLLIQGGPDFSEVPMPETQIEPYIYIFR